MRKIGLLAGMVMTAAAGWAACEDEAGRLAAALRARGAAGAGVVEVFYNDGLAGWCAGAARRCEVYARRGGAVGEWLGAETQGDEALGAVRERLLRRGPRVAPESWTVRTCVSEEWAAGEELRVADVREIRYPRLALLARLQGEVEAALTLGAGGVVEAVEVLRGPRVLTEPVEAGVRGWRVIPEGVDLARGYRVVMRFAFETFPDGSVAREGTEYAGEGRVVIRARELPPICRMKAGVRR